MYPNPSQANLPKTIQTDNLGPLGRNQRQSKHQTTKHSRNATLQHHTYATSAQHTGHKSTKVAVRPWAQRAHQGDRASPHEQSHFLSSHDTGLEEQQAGAGYRMNVSLGSNIAFPPFRKSHSLKRNMPSKSSPKTKE